MGARDIGTATSQKRRLLLIDNHPILRDGLAYFIRSEPDLEICGQVGNSVKALYDIAALKPDLVILDIILKDCNGLDLIKRIRTLYRELPILAFSVNEELLYAERALRAGALGYVMKQSAGDEVVLAIRRVLRGERYLSARVQEHMAEKLSGTASSVNSIAALALEHLSDREMEVFQLIGEGYSTRQVASKRGKKVSDVIGRRADGASAAQPAADAEG